MSRGCWNGQRRHMWIADVDVEGGGRPCRSSRGDTPTHAGEPTLIVMHRSQARLAPPAPPPLPLLAISLVSRNLSPSPPITPPTLCSPLLGFVLSLFFPYSFSLCFSPLIASSLPSQPLPQSRRFIAGIRARGFFGIAPCCKLARMFRNVQAHLIGGS